MNIRTNRWRYRNYTWFCSSIYYTSYDSGQYPTCQNHDAVDTVVEAVDTIVESTNGQFITDIPNRAHLYQGQTPQTFRCKDFMDLYGSLSAEEKEILTDACKIFVIKGKDVALAKGEYSNLKITTVTDLKIAKSMIEKD